jgi:DNA-binding XRE family transcriptional regulator
MTIHQRIREGRARLGLTEQQFADRAGVSRGAVQQWEKEGGTAPNRSRQPVVAALLGLSVADLLAPCDSVTQPTTPVPALTGPSPVPAPGEAGIPVAMLANSASMGGGADALSEDVLCGQISLAPSFVHDYIRPTRPDALRFVHSYGDSMHPTFSSGDVLLVDTGVREPRIDGVYVLAAHGRLFIKRVRQRMDGSMEVSSDNPGHKTVDTLNGDHAIDVLGRVVWCWNGRKV